MARAIPQTDSPAAVNADHLLVVFDPASDSPLAQSIRDIVRAVFTAALEAKLAGIAVGAQVNLTGAALQTAIDQATGSTHWRSAHTVLRTAVQVRDLLDGLLGTAWRTGDGSGTSGITLDQAIDGVGAALAMLGEFSYDAAANTFTFALADDSVESSKAKAATGAEKAAWRTKIGAAVEATVTTVAANTVIAADGDNRTYRLTGATALRISLPDLAAVSPGWTVVVDNGSTADATLAPNGSQTIGGAVEVVVPLGVAVKVQAVSGSRWSIIADTGKGGSGEEVTGVTESRARAIAAEVTSEALAAQPHPKRVAALPENAEPGELFFLTTQTRSPAHTHLYSFTPDTLQAAAPGPPQLRLVEGAARVAIPSSGLGDLAASTSSLPAIFAADKVYWVATSQNSGGDNLVSVGVAAAVAAPDSILLAAPGIPDQTVALAVVPGGNLTIGGVAVARYTGIYRGTGSLAQSWVDVRGNNRQVRFGLIRGGAYLHEDATYDEPDTRNPGLYVRMADLSWLRWSPTREPYVLQAALNGEDRNPRSAVTSLTLPADYADWRNLVVGGWETQEDDIVQGSAATALLAAQTGRRIVVLAGNPGAGKNFVGTWDPSTRILNITGGDTILYAALE